MFCIGICIEVIFREVHSILEDGDIREDFEDSNRREVFEVPGRLTCIEAQRPRKTQRRMNSK